MESSPTFFPSFWMSSINFLSLSSEEVKRLSVKRLTNPTTFDDSYIQTMVASMISHWVLQKLTSYVSRGLNYIHCPGHFGHITLPLLVFHPIFFSDFYQIFSRPASLVIDWVPHPKSAPFLKVRMNNTWLQ